MSVESNIFVEIGIIIIAATGAALLMQLLRQPKVLGYILAGIIIGPFALKFIQNSADIATLSEIGIAFLLFIVGLELDLKRLKDTGFTALTVGLIQLAGTFALGFWAASWFGLSFREMLYLGLVLAFSSTTIVIKLLADKKELDTLHGRIILGILLVQDAVAILVLALLPNLDNPSAKLLFISVGNGLLLFIVAVAAARFVVPYLFRFVARSRELLFLTAVSWCFGFSLAAYLMGYSIAIGAFLAGVALASSSFSIEIASRVRSLRDFFATIFFVSLGMQVIFSGLHIVLPLLVLSLLVLIATPVIVAAVMGALGHKSRTAFLTGIGIAQVSEFSLIIAALGASLGHVSAEFVSLTAMLAIITIVLTTYLIKYDEQLYQASKPFFRYFERFGKRTEHLEFGVATPTHTIVLAGYNRIGYGVLESLKKMGQRALVVDFNPELIMRLKKERQPCLYGDVGDVDIIEKMNLKDAEALISTVPTRKDSLLLLKKAKKANPHCMVILTANTSAEALDYYKKGADYVVMPHFLSGEHLSLLLADFAKDGTHVQRTKIAHLQELYRRS